MTVPDRVQQLLAKVPIEDVLRGRDVEEASKLLGFSASVTYKKLSDGTLGHIKIEGRVRKGKGRAGSVRVRLLDVVTWQVQNERIAAGTRP